MNKTLSHISIILVLLTYPAQWSHGDDAPDLQGIFGMEEPDGADWGEIGGWSPVWGALNTENFPWIKSINFGWMYLGEEATPEGYWLWIDILGWFYSSRERFPEFYSARYGGWGLFDLTEQRRIKYYLHSIMDWILIRKPGVYPDDIYDEVPDELYGLKYEGYTSSAGSPRLSHVIEVGRCHFREWYVTGLGYVESIYYYNAGDQRFYLLEHTAPYSKGSLANSGRWHRFKIERDADSMTLIREDLIFGGEPQVETYPITEP